MRLRLLVVACSLATLTSCAAPSGATSGKPGSGLKVAAPMSAPAEAVGLSEASLRTEAAPARFATTKPGWGVRVVRSND